MDEEDRGNGILKDVSVSQLRALIIKAALNSTGVKDSKLELEQYSGKKAPFAADLLEETSAMIIKKACAELLKAEVLHEPIRPLTLAFSNLTIQEAYEIQLRMIRNKVSHGQKIVGKKVGLTSLAKQQLFAVDQPYYGHLLSGMRIENKGYARMNRMFKPKVEAAIAFVLHKDLRGSHITIEDVFKASEYIVLALEIVDSRIADWGLKLEDMIADNASSGLFILGDQKFGINTFDLAQIQVKLFRNGELMNTGSGADVLGNPAACVAWLANQLSEHGEFLKAGEIVLSGALSAAVEANRGDHVVAEFNKLGTVEVLFS